MNIPWTLSEPSGVRKDGQVTHNKLLHYSYLSKPLEFFLYIMSKKFFCQPNTIECSLLLSTGFSQPSKPIVQSLAVQANARILANSCCIIKLMAYVHHLCVYGFGGKQFGLGSAGARHFLLYMVSTGLTYAFAVSWQNGWRMLVLDDSQVLELVLALSWTMCLQQISSCFFNMKAGSKTAQWEQAPKSSAFRVSVCITFANVSLAKEIQRAMPKINVEGCHMKA